MRTMAEYFVNPDHSVNYAQKDSPDTTQRSICENVSYIGVSDISVEIHFRDGSKLRVTNSREAFALNREAIPSPEDKRTSQLWYQDAKP